MRHFPFPIDQAARDRWLGHMLAAIEEAGIAEPARGMMRAYFERASLHMINVEALAPDSIPTENPEA
jgi:hemoglobin